MVGAFPPPLHGMAAVNAEVRDRLLDEGMEVITLNVAAPSLERGLFRRLQRLPNVVRALARLTLMVGKRGKPLYMSVSGGAGQVYELLFLGIAWMAGMRIVLHHHSFAYLNRRSRFTVILIRLAGNGALHVVQSPGMKMRLGAIYPPARRIIALSNAALLCEDGGTIPSRERLRVIGFLSNLSAEKGVFDFLNVCAATLTADLSVVAKLAGPFQDEATERQVRLRLSSLPNVEYLGALYGAGKTSFYREVDALLFPTRYRNETEALVVLEGIQQGLSVIAFGRGAIPEYIDESCGHVVSVGGDFVSETLKVLQRWLDDPEVFREAGLSARRRFVEVRSNGLAAWEVLKAELTGCGGEDAGVSERTRTTR